jgi:hypothetical protein
MQRPAGLPCEDIFQARQDGQVREQGRLADVRLGKEFSDNKKTVNKEVKGG